MAEGLILAGVRGGYGGIEVLHQVSLEVKPGELVCLLGGNAAGKSTTMMTILGMVRATHGTIHWEGQEIQGRPTADIVKRGIAIVPEGRRIFPRMSVEENLELGAWLRQGDIKEDLERVYNRFPRLAERRWQHAGTLSGGEQQMLAMGRALLSRPRLLLLDEPSMGLAPALVDQVFDLIVQIHEEGVAILLVEQNARKALSVSSRGYVLTQGTIALEGTGTDLLKSEEVRHAYLGG